MGIIGGPDGPTAIFISASPAGIAVWVMLAAAGIGMSIWLIRRKRKK